MDVSGMSARERQAKHKYTVLTSKSPEGWMPQEIRLLSSLQPMAEVYRTQLCPYDIILSGEYSPEAVAAALGNDRFEHKIVTGLLNPDLPFRPPSY